MAEFYVKTNRRCEIIDITEDVNRVLPQNIPCGICHIFCPHTTAGITINENADPDVKHDVLQKLSALIPHDEAYYQHCEGNSDAHLKAILTGFCQTVPFRNGRLELGTWQGIYFCEYDGPRTRHVKVYFESAQD